MNTPISDHVRRLWLAGADVDSIARTLGTHRAAIARQLVPLDDTNLVAGLRVHLASLVDSRPAKGKGSRTAAVPGRP